MGKLDTITSSADFMSDPNTYDTVYLIACDCKTNADADKDDIGIISSERTTSELASV